MTALGFDTLEGPGPLIQCRLLGVGKHCELDMRSSALHVAAVGNCFSSIRK